MAECPSKPYLDLVVTAGGLTPRDPFGKVSSNWDYAEWRVTAEQTIANMEKAREFLGANEPSPFSEWERMRERSNDVRARFAELPNAWDFFDTFDVKVEVPKAVALAIDAACLWEEHDQASSALGKEPPGRPSEVPGGKGGPDGDGYKFVWWHAVAGGAAIAVLAGGVTLAFARRPALGRGR